MLSTIHSDVELQRIQLNGELVVLPSDIVWTLLVITRFRRYNLHL